MYLNYVDVSNGVQKLVSHDQKDFKIQTKREKKSSGLLHSWKLPGGLIPCSTRLTEPSTCVERYIHFLVL
jgi:hypothetical protein